MFNKKIASELAIGIILLIAIAIGGVFWLQNKKINNQSEQKSCTMEAKICPGGAVVGRSGPNCEFAPCPENKTSQMANPASVFCVQNGGKSEIRTVAGGSQTGYCKFDDGSECEEWAYFRKECEKGNLNAEINTSDWQTYKNEKYGYDLMYPPGYIVKKNDTLSSCNLNLNDEKGLNDISIRISDYDNYEKHKEYIDKDIILDFDVFINDLNDRCIDNAYSWIGGPKAQTPKLIKSENLKINGAQVLKRTYAHLDSAGVPIDHYFSTWRFKGSDSYYTLMYNNGKEMKTNVPSDIFIKFLENFKFAK